STDGSSRGFRDFDHPERAGIREFYRLNHRHQTFDFAAAKREEFSRHDRAWMSVWEALEFLNTLVDDSDPDLGLSQLDHLLQTAEAIRGDGHPDWFVLTGLVHDLGKVLCLWGEPQWAVVGDTFPVGCAFDERVVYQELFAHNPDSYDPRYRSELGVYDANCGLRRVRMSWGHDEYLFGVLEPYLPEPALYMIRYHSFYAAHREGAYDHLMNDHDREMFAWVRTFNPYDLYSKSDTAPDLGSLRPYYEDLVDHYLPPVLSW
ncbi:MAG: inositol oxygenase family protein, partial [Acidobacteriota bacterium]|nr:inositol oxygenase family protein [Acidobacteriota bacterium]